MGGAIAGLIIIAALTLWIVAASKLHTHGGNKGLRFFFIQLGIAVAICALLFLIIVVPVINCSGWFCGLGEILLFMLLGTLVLLIYPIVLIVIARRKFNNINPDETDVLDDFI